MDRLRKLALKIGTIKLLLILLIPIQYILFSMLSDNQSWVEGVYFEKIFRSISICLRYLTYYLPFSLGELILWCGILYTVFSIINGIRKIRRKKITFIKFIGKFVINCLAVYSVVYFLFVISWGMNYHRTSFAEKAGLIIEDSNEKDLKELCNTLVPLINNVRLKLKVDNDSVVDLPQSKEHYLKEAYQGYSKLKKEYPEFDFEYLRAKPITVEFLFNKLGVGGIYCPFTAEANVLTSVPDPFIPEVICHELAHQCGIAPENEANYIAFMTSVMNDDPYFQYSGLLGAFSYSIRALAMFDEEEYKKVIDKLDPGVMKDFGAYSKYWKHHTSFISGISNFIYNLYLKSNSQSDGIKSYGMVVKLLVADYKSESGVLRKLCNK